jgi:prefoldin subunit 5
MQKEFEMEEKTDLVEKIKDIDGKLDELKRAIDNLSMMMSALNIVTSNKPNVEDENIEKIKEADEAMKSLSSTITMLNKAMRN